MSIMALAITMQAQTMIGSWLTAPIPPTPANDEGWQRGSGGFGPDGSIFASSNYPTYFELVPNVAAGYAQSLDIHETGYGNVRLYISLSPSQIAAFTNNSQLNFTFSCDSSANSGNATAGYMQLVQFQYNASTLGSSVTVSPSTANNFSETGDTGNNNSGQPVFDFYSGSAARSQVVTWDYSSAKATIGSPSSVQFVFVFQVGGGAPTNVYINNVTLSGAETQNPSIVIDQFNPTNNPYAGTNIYAEGDITNIYGYWFGDAVTNFDQITWDPTMDAQTNANSGSLKITANFTGTSSQWIITDAAIGSGVGPGINPPITNGYSLLTFEFDVKYDPSSPIWVTGGTTNFGHLEWGIAGGPVGGYSGSGYGSVNVNVTNTGWTHVVIPLNAETDADLTNISNIFFKQDGGSYGNLVGTSILWLDNLKFTYTNTPPVIPPPTLSIQKANPALRIFAGSTGAVYDREELATVDESQSWIGGSYPVSYSFKLLDYPANINQTHIFLVPVNTSGQANMGNGGTANEYIEYQATNTLWMVIGPSGTNVTASVQWKTNLPNANPGSGTMQVYTTNDMVITTNTVVNPIYTSLVITNSTAVGTWTLTFNSASTGTLTAPGASPVAFTIADANVASDFANPLVAYFGVQPNTGAGEGEYEDWASISVSSVSGVNENEDFTKEPTASVSGVWANNSALASSLQVISTNNLPAYWVNWTLPAIDYGLATAMAITGNTNTPPYPWVSPEYYNNYTDAGNNNGSPVLPNQSQQGNKIWVAVPANDLPTADGSVGGTLAPDAFFELINPPLDY